MSWQALVDNSTGKRDKGCLNKTRKENNFQQPRNGVLCPILVGGRGGEKR